MRSIFDSVPPENWVVVTLLVLFSIWMVRKIIQRILFVPPQWTYVTTSLAGTKRIVDTHRFLWNPFERVVRGQRQAERFEISHLNKVTRKPESRFLMDASTGKISLLGYSLHLSEIKATTTDGHLMMVDAELHFKLDPEKLLNCFGFGDFGDELTSRFSESVRAEIYKREDQDIHQQFHDIKKSAEETLTCEAKSLGIIITNVLLDILEVEECSHASSLTGEANVGGLNVPSMSASTISSSARQLDKIRDVFLPGNPAPDQYEKANQTLMQILEMQSRENIARELAQAKGSLIVTSTEEMGMVKQALYRQSNLPSGEATDTEVKE